MNDKPLFDPNTPTSVRLNDAISFVADYGGPYRLQDLADEVEGKEVWLEALMELHRRIGMCPGPAILGLGHGVNEAWQKSRMLVPKGTRETRPETPPLEALYLGVPKRYWPLIDQVRDGWKGDLTESNLKDERIAAYELESRAAKGRIGVLRLVARRYIDAPSESVEKVLALKALETTLAAQESAE
jgi:hypothetical protein